MRIPSPNQQAIIDKAVENYTENSSIVEVRFVDNLVSYLNGNSFTQNGVPVENVSELQDPEACAVEDSGLFLILANESVLDKTDDYLNYIISHEALHISNQQRGEFLVLSEQEKNRNFPKFLAFTMIEECRVEKVLHQDGIDGAISGHELEQRMENLYSSLYQSDPQDTVVNLYHSLYAFSHVVASDGKLTQRGLDLVHYWGSPLIEIMNLLDDSPPANESCLKDVLMKLADKLMESSSKFYKSVETSRSIIIWCPMLNYLIKH